MQGMHDLTDRSGEVPPVDVEKIDVISPEIL